MRYIVYGAGAIGGAIGAALHLAGRDVVLIARGRHLEALRTDGLAFQTAAGERRLALPTAGAPQELEITRDDVVLLTMKSQDTGPALEALVAAAEPGTAVVCAQNGVENERATLRRFANTYGMFVYMPAQLLEPGVVQVFAAPPLGVLDVGRVPRGSDRRCELIARDLEGAGFASQPQAQIMSWKYAKLLSNLGNAVEALLGARAEGGELVRRARDEALACYAAAGTDYASDAEVAERVTGNEKVGPVAGQARGGGSSWQSVARGSGTIETEYLNGEIVLLGRLHRVPTPVNEALTEIATRLARERATPGAASAEEIEARVTQLGG